MAIDGNHKTNYHYKHGNIGGKKPAMCDVLVSTANFTDSCELIFAKNSDRDPNESQLVEISTTGKFPAIISRPWWMWGAEMGANIYGLAIGNTAVFTKVKYNKRGILGMDILRDALEKNKTARQALDFITSKIELQGGNASYEHKMYYHNSFVIADPEQAWVLETAGKHWVAKQIKDVYSISNALTIENDWDLASENINFNFSKYFSDKFFTYFAHGRERREFTYKKLKERGKKINLEFIMTILRSGENPIKGSMKDICIHYGGITKPVQTTSSQISEISDKISIHWFTATSLPCISIYKPFYLTDKEISSLSSFLSSLNSKTTNQYNKDSYWWRMERFHRKFQTNYKSYIEEFLEDRDKLQRDIIEKAREARKTDKLLQITTWAFEEEKKFVEKWEEKIESKKHNFWFRIINKKSGLSQPV